MKKSLIKMEWGLFFLALLAAGCAKENVLGKVAGDTDTIVVLDTVYLDTLFDTLRVPGDTAKIIAGKPGLVLFGSVIGYRNAGFDSVQAALSAVSANYAGNLTVRLDSHAVPYIAGQELRELWWSRFGGWSPELLDGFVFSNLGAANYAVSFPRADSAFACTVRVPYYLTDTSTALSFDTLTDALVLPEPVDTMVFFHDSGVVYDTVDYFSGPSFGGPFDTLYRIHLDRGLGVRWPKTRARWYAVQALKVLDEGFGYSVVGTALDTFTTDSQLVIPQSFVWQPGDTLFHPDTSYNFIEVYVLAVNGPSPAENDTLPDFEGRGLLYGLDYQIAIGDATATPFLNVKAGKRRAGIKKTRPAGILPNELLNRVLKKFPPNG